MLLLRFFVDYETVIESNYHDMLTMNEASLLTRNHRRRLIFSSWLENNIIYGYNIFKWYNTSSNVEYIVFKANITGKHFVNTCSNICENAITILGLEWYVYVHNKMYIR